eukprot:scaffold32381_cov107-Isochrysis_galbana.AAC.3
MAQRGRAAVATARPAAKGRIRRGSRERTATSSLDRGPLCACASQPPKPGSPATAARRAHRRRHSQPPRAPPP